MLFREIIAVYFEKHTKPINTFCWKSAELLIIKTGGTYSYQWALKCLLYVRLPKMSNQYTFTLKMATAMFTEMLENFQHLTWLIPKSHSCTFIVCGPY
jgi:hypothetical protein